MKKKQNKDNKTTNKIIFYDKKSKQKRKQLKKLYGTKKNKRT